MSKAYGPDTETHSISLRGDFHSFIQQIQISAQPVDKKMNTVEPLLHIQ